jgi:hypothetical protein
LRKKAISNGCSCEEASLIITAMQPNSTALNVISSAARSIGDWEELELITGLRV